MLNYSYKLSGRPFLILPIAPNLHMDWMSKFYIALPTY